MHSTAPGPELLTHYTIVIYPFRHHLLAGCGPDRLATLEPRWAPWGSRLAGPDLANALEASTFFLPYIRGVLYPEVVRLQEETAGEPYGEWANLLHEWAGAGLGSFARELPRGCVVRLTCQPALASALGAFTLVQEREVSAHFDWVDAVLFPCGMGFLLLKARLAGDRPRLSDLIQLNHALRTVHPPRSAAALSRLRFAGGEELSAPDLLEYLTQGLVAPWDVPEEERGLFPLRSSGTERAYTDSEAGRAYGERCQFLSYAGIDLAKAGELAAGPFPTPCDRVLFELATCIGLGESVHNPVWVPSIEQARRFASENRVSLWRCWTSMVLKESFVFLATEDLHFTRKSLPRRVENEYLALYLYTLYQKFQLYTFSTDLMHEVALSTGHLRGARALAQRFVGFRTRYWFSEVTRKPQGGDLYRVLQQGLDVPSLYAQVTNSVKEVKEHYEAVWARQVQRFKDALTYGGPATVVVGAVRMCLGDTEHPWALGAVLAALVVAFFVLLQVMRAWAGKRAPARRRRRALPLPAFLLPGRRARSMAP